MTNDIAAEYDALLQFLYLAPVGLVQIDPDGDIVMINPLSAQLLMPLSRNGMLSNLFAATESVAPELRHMVHDFGDRTGTICDGFRVQVNAGAPGREDPKVLSFSLVKLDAHRLMAVISDVSLIVRRERELRQTEAWFNAIVNGVADYALTSIDADGNVEQWNAGIGRLTGFAAEHVVGRPFSLFYPPLAFSGERLADYLGDADENGWVLFEGWGVKAGGARYWTSSLIVPLDRLQDGSVAGMRAGRPGYALIVRDISDKRDARESLLRASMSDHLTGVANRRAFFEAAEVELKRWRRAPRPLSLIMLDADHFKRINDEFGHPAGDAVLRDLAAALLQTVREIDVVARMGGEEFAILLPSTDTATAQAVAERIRAEIAGRTVAWDGASIRYTVSIGVSGMHDGLDGMDCMLKLADQAMYAAKRNGRNRVELAAMQRLSGQVAFS